MKEFSQNNFKLLFSNLCCSKCKNDFSIDSIDIKDRENDILICNLKCNICGHDFGDIILNINHKTNKHLPMEIIDGPAPITEEDVLNAYCFIKKMK